MFDLVRQPEDWFSGVAAQFICFVLISDNIRHNSKLVVQPQRARMWKFQI